MTAAGRKKISEASKARWAKYRKTKNGDSGDGKVVPGTLISVEYQNGKGQVEKVYLRRKDDPKPAAVMARTAHA